MSDEIESASLWGDRRIPRKIWLRVDSRIETGCWLWTGYVRRDGYGVINRGGRIERVHRLMYATFIAPLDPDLVIDHRCRVRRCCNPAHLDQVTDRVNVVERASATSIAVQRLKQTHCVNGHEFTPENTFTRPQRPGTRECRACQDARNKARARRAR